MIFEALNLTIGQNNTIDEILENQTDKMIVLLGNKIDKNNEREVSYGEALKYAQKNSLYFFESSAKYYISIDSLISVLV